jgi:hypothetical protein
LSQRSSDIVDITISTIAPSGTNWFVEFGTTNSAFTVGTYTNAQRSSGGPTVLSFSGNGRGDNTADGFFNILGVTYANGIVTSFAADFVQFDEGDTNAWNEGSVRYNSTIPDTVDLSMAPVAISVQGTNVVLNWSTNLVGSTVLRTPSPHWGRRIG